MAMVEDLSVFFNTDEFAEEAIWSESSDPVLVIFDKTYLESLGMSGSDPIALGIETDFPGIEEGQSLTIRGTEYRITTPQPDGTGLVSIQLEVANG
jgi:hypothetical protein